MREFRREIEIDAPPERVWAVVTDFAAYPDWNPFIRRISGELHEGAKLEVRIEPPGARATTFKPTVRAVEANRELRWLGRLLLPGIFDGEHSLRIEPLDGGRSRFVHVGAFQRPPRRASQGHDRKDRGRVRADEHRAQGAGRAGIRLERRPRSGERRVRAARAASSRPARLAPSQARTRSPTYSPVTPCPVATS